ncbi:MAG TPA: serine/threonine-protein kinase [Kofleriaceae bacterium]|nr:serine/threonine-protein kinase [Kofleriaceae bacterium]
MTRYELLERIGVGGMAEIFRGKAVAAGGFEKPVAIKRVLPHLSQDNRFVELLIAEAKILSQLRHRNIVQIYDVGLGDDRQYFLVMEFVEGTDLGALFGSITPKNKRLPAHITLHIGAEVCEALDHAHRSRGPDGQVLGLVHRDVSPSNVMLSQSGEVKLTDFGIATRMEEATGHGGVRGKFAYISPEQAFAQRVDARSDVFSLGIVLYELFLGRRLFSGLADFDALAAVREAKIPRPRSIDPGLSPELEEILMTALAKDPGHRFPDAATFGAKLRGYRYAALSQGGDPAKEIARILARYAGNDAPSGRRERTFVKIATAAGFDGGLDGAKPAAAEHLRQARAVIDQFEEETRAMDISAAELFAQQERAELGESAGAGPGSSPMEDEDKTTIMARRAPEAPGRPTTEDEGAVIRSVDVELSDSVELDLAALGMAQTRPRPADREPPLRADPSENRVENRGPARAYDRPTRESSVPEVRYPSAADIPGQRPRVLANTKRAAKKPSARRLARWQLWLIWIVAAMAAFALAFFITGVVLADPAPSAAGVIDSGSPPPAVDAAPR